MLMGFDIGNTNTKIGIFDRSALPLETFAYNTHEKNSLEAAEEDILKNINDFLAEYNFEIDGFAFSSVVPKLNTVYHSISKRRFGLEPIEINHRCRMSIEILYENPAQLGVDRIVNAEAAYREYGGDLIIVDIGTAATFCVLIGNRFEGGIISPGIELTIKALADNTANLPKIDFCEPDRLVARDSINAIRSGFFYGWISLVEGMLKRIKDEYNKPLKVIFTGGFSRLIAQNIKIDSLFDEYLSMKGIKYLYEQNI